MFELYVTSQPAFTRELRSTLITSESVVFMLYLDVRFQVSVVAGFIVTELTFDLSGRVNHLNMRAQVCRRGERFGTMLTNMAYAFMYTFDVLTQRIFSQSFKFTLSTLVEH